MIINDLITGEFVERPNRFLVLFEVDDKVFEAHLKDPGRLNELLTPRVKLLLKKVGNTTKRKTKYDVVGVLHHDKWVIINSSLHSDLAANIIESDFLKELIGYDIERREYSYGKSRIDFLLRKDKEKMLLEVKGCTLVEEGTALFPDAPTLRGKKHVLELTNALEESYKSTVLFLIMRDDAEIFKPNYKTDPEFSNALKIASEKGVKILAYSFKNILIKDKLEIKPYKSLKIDF
ncbi:MAG: DNA/RNA nuclease SfsA [Methanobacteriaceae archaeon]|nr:DNA/RNA nuclease SfsA [Methanobacteriaceae archaeon]